MNAVKFCNGRLDQIDPPLCLLLADGDAAVVAAGLAGLVTTVRENHGCAIFHMYHIFSLTFFWVFPPVAFPAVLNRFRAGVDMGRGEKDTKIFLHTFENHYFFAGRFMARPWGICLICFLSLLCMGLRCRGPTSSRTPSATLGTLPQFWRA